MGGPGKGHSGSRKGKGKSVGAPPRYAPAGGRSAPKGGKGTARSPGGRGQVEEPGPALPLDEQSLLHIKAFVQAAGGNCVLGKICRDFEGLKKAQLEDHFEFTRAGDQWEVMLLMDDELTDFSEHLLPPGRNRLHVEGAADHRAAREDVFMPPPRRFAEPRAPERQRAPEREPPAELPPLSEEQIQEITEALESHGGVLPLGRLCQQFLGLKRPQLEGHFELNMVGNHGQWEVRLPGCEAAPAEIMFDGKGYAADADLPGLTEEQIMIITDYLAAAEHGRPVPMTEVFKACPGVKRRQLEPHFQLTKIDKKHYTVGLLNQEMPPPAPRAPPAAARASPPQPTPLGDDTLAEVDAFLSDSGGSMLFNEILVVFPGIRRSQLVGFFQFDRDAEGRVVVSQLGHAAPGGQQDVPPLDAKAIDDIAAALHEMGGTAPLGKLTRGFRFLKRAQLDGIFYLELKGDQWMVSLTPFGGKQPPIMKGKSKGKGKAQGSAGGKGLPPIGAPPAQYRGPPATEPKGKGHPKGHGAKGGPKGDLSRAGKDTKRKREEEPAGPPPPLDDGVLLRIEDFLHEQNGRANMGRVSAVFEGVKRLQLEGHFELTRVGDHGQWEVSLPEAKRQRLA